MAEMREAFVGIDVAKLRNAVAVADAGRDGEVRFHGEVDASAESMRRLAAKLAGKHERLHFCYEAGPTGYGLHRLLTQNLWRRATNGSIPGRCGTDRGNSLMGNKRMPVPATALDHEGTIVAIVELSARSWLVGARDYGPGSPSGSSSPSIRRRSA